MIEEKPTNEFKIEPSSDGGYWLYRKVMERYCDEWKDNECVVPFKARWNHVAHYKSKRLARKYVAHLAQPPEYITIER